MRAFYVLGILCSSQVAASAQPAPSDAEPRPPVSSEGWIDRPLVLPRGQVQVGAAFDMSAASAMGESHTGTSLVESAAFGLGHRVQIGASLTQSIDPEAFGSATATAILGFDEQKALRFDAALTRATDFVSHDPSFPMSTNGVSFGVGVPIKVKLSRYVALVSGSTGASGFGMPFAHTAPQGLSTGAGATPSYFGEPVFAVIARENLLNRYVLTLPVGLLVAPTDGVALRLHGAYQTMWGETGQDGSFRDSFVLGGAELLIALPARLDLGASIDTVLSASSSTARWSYNDLEGGTQVALWMQGRFGG